MSDSVEIPINHILLLRANDEILQIIDLTLTSNS